MSLGKLINGFGWSPDGRYLVYVTNGNSSGFAIEILAINIILQQFFPVAGYLSAFGVFNAKWNPNGVNLAASNSNHITFVFNFVPGVVPK